MFDHDTNANGAVSRRNVLKTAGGLLAGSTMLAGLGAGRSAAATEESIQVGVQEITEEYITVEVRHPVHPGPYNPQEVPEAYYLGHVDQFVIHDNAVSLPDDTEKLATPLERERLDEATYRMYFRTADIDFSEVEGEEVTLGLGVFPERTVSRDYWGRTSEPEGPDDFPTL